MSKFCLSCVIMDRNDVEKAKNSRDIWKRTFQIWCVGIFLALLSVEGLLLVITHYLGSGDAANEDFCLGPDNCGEMSDLLHNYLDKTINERFDRLQQDEENRFKNGPRIKNYLALKSYLQTAYYEMIPAARVVGDYSKRGNDICGNYIECMDDLQPILYWTHSGRVRDNGVFLRHGMKYRHGRLVVPVKGQYYVYSYLAIHEPETNHNKERGSETDFYGGERPAIKHAIYRFNIIEGKEEKLVETSHSRREIGRSEFNVCHSRIGSVVQLKAGDELIVKVSNVALLVNPGNNYFGVNMI